MRYTLNHMCQRRGLQLHRYTSFRVLKCSNTWFFFAFFSPLSRCCFSYVIFRYSTFRCYCCVIFFLFSSSKQLSKTPPCDPPHKQVMIYSDCQTNNKMYFRGFISHPNEIKFLLLFLHEMEKEEDEFTKQTSKTITRDEGKTHTNSLWIKFRERKRKQRKRKWISIEFRMVLSCLTMILNHFGATKSIHTHTIKR